MLCCQRHAIRAAVIAHRRCQLVLEDAAMFIMLPNAHADIPPSAHSHRRQSLSDIATRRQGSSAKRYAPHPQRC